MNSISTLLTQLRQLKLKLALEGMIVGLGSGLVVVFYRLILEKVEHIRQFVFSSQHSIWYTISWFILLILVALFVGETDDERSHDLWKWNPTSRGGSR